MNQLESLVPIAQAHLDSGLDTEEATKMALVMPVLQVLGYNVFDPSEVIPEYTADIGTRRFEKVDYAVKNGEDLAMIIEVKVLGTDLDRVVPQLARYFGTVECQLGVLTDGETWRFYMDLNAPNVMDTEPFLSVSLVKDDPDTIKPFSKGFDLAKIREDAEFHRNRDALVQSSAETISEWLAQQMREPADSFVNYVRVNLIKDIHRDTLSEALKQGLVLFMESDNEDLAPRRVQGQDKAERDQEIRRLFNSGLKQVEIARRMGISNSVVWVVLNNYKAPR